MPGVARLPRRRLRERRAAAERVLRELRRVRGGGRALDRGLLQRVRRRDRAAREVSPRHCNQRVGGVEVTADERGVHVASTSRFRRSYIKCVLVH